VTRGKRNLDFSSFVVAWTRPPVPQRSNHRPGRPEVRRDCIPYLCVVAFFDAEHSRRLVFLTNNFELPALTIAGLYKSRWQVELFFKWIKQNLRIKGFYGTSENAVKTQVWIAIGVYVLVAIVRKELKSERTLSEILQILSLTLFEKTPISQAFADEKAQNVEGPSHKQLTLFDI
jgi:transposase